MNIHQLASATERFLFQGAGWVAVGAGETGSECGAVGGSTAGSHSGQRCRQKRGVFGGGDVSMSGSYTEEGGLGYPDLLPTPPPPMEFCRSVIIIIII